MLRLTAIMSLMALFSGSATAQPGKPAPSPCALVTKAEVQQAVGSAVSDGAVNPNNKSVCDFKVGSAGSVLNIMLTPKGPGDSADKMVAELKKRRIAAVVTPGLGDGAYSSSPGYGMQQLGVYKGSNHVIVTALLAGAPEAKTKSALQAVMSKALARLP